MPEQHSILQKLYQEAFEGFQEDGIRHEPLWVSDLRKSAMDQFNTRGFPVARRGNEEWKYTDVGPLARKAFKPLLDVTFDPGDIGDAPSFSPDEPTWNQLVFIDGILAKDYSLLPSVPAGVQILSLTDAIQQEGEFLKKHLAQHAKWDDDSFAALNTAFMGSGAFIHVPDEVEVVEPIHLLFLHTPQHQDSITHPRALVCMGKNSAATVIESYGGLLEGEYFTNQVTEVVADSGANLTYYKIQRQGARAYHVTTTQVVLAEQSTFTSVYLDLGGRLVRNNLNVLTQGEGSRGNLNGLYMVRGSQHVDNQIFVDHAQANTNSRQLYRGVLDGRSRSVFHGSILVRPQARGVNAYQEDKNLLLSSQAEADTKPAFWIYCDDVKCGHGAACGQIQEDALLYLRTRGIGEDEARKLLIRAFVGEVVDSVSHPAFRRHLEGLVDATLGQWLSETARTEA